MATTAMWQLDCSKCLNLIRQVLCAGTRNTVTEKRYLEFENEDFETVKISQINDKRYDCND
ncbi:hypothetical protein Avbf_05590 [Armadillidium vulgare]|nr:hypothetical protein Avbf_05590 [Armadillidium vulgare]